MLPEKDSVLEKPPHFDPDNIILALMPRYTLQPICFPHLHLKTQPDYAEQNGVEGSDNNVRNTLCGIVRHSTLWLKPEAVAQIAFLEWTGVETSASYCTSSWAE
jgi:hypothetical protein